MTAARNSVAPAASSSSRTHVTTAPSGPSAVGEKIVKFCFADKFYDLIAQGSKLHGLS